MFSKSFMKWFEEYRYQELIYPSVKESLGLEFDIPYYEEMNVLGIYDFDEAIRTRLSYIYEKGVI